MIVQLLITYQSLFKTMFNYLWTVSVVKLSAAYVEGTQVDVC